MGGNVTIRIGTTRATRATISLNVARVVRVVQLFTTELPAPKINPRIDLLLLAQRATHLRRSSNALNPLAELERPGRLKQTGSRWLPETPPGSMETMETQRNTIISVSSASYVSILFGGALRAAGVIIRRFDLLSLARHVSRLRHSGSIWGTGAACHIHHPERFTVKYILPRRSLLYACCQPTPPENKVPQTAPAP
jgi:hypothetical protein